jgi:hypothetical protein
VFLSLLAAASAYVRPPHLLQGCFDVSPRFTFFRFTRLLEASSLLSRLNDCHFAMGLKQLSGVVMDVNLTHPHDAVLLSLENNHTHILINIGAAVLDFMGRPLPISSGLASSFARMIVAAA